MIRSRSKRTISCIILSLFILVFSSSVVFANGNENNSVSVDINGNKLQSDVNAFIDENGRTLVPFRVFMNQIGINNINYNTQTKEIIAKNDSGTEIRMTIGDYFAYVNGKRVLLNAPARIYMDRTMIPLRFFSEQFGMNVSYNNTNRVVSISSDNISSSVGNVNSSTNNVDIPKVYLGNPDGNVVNNIENTNTDNTINNDEDEDEYVIINGMKQKRTFQKPINPNE